jgi:hypothetical protein
MLLKLLSGVQIQLAFAIFSYSKSNVLYLSSLAPFIMCHMRPDVNSFEKFFQFNENFPLLLESLIYLIFW